MPVLVDTNVLIDIAYDDPEWRGWSQGQLEQHAGELVINPIIFAEFSYRYRDIETVEAALDPEEFLREHIPWEAAFAAGQAFRLYRQRGGGREQVLPDFLIGGHAAVRGYPIVTRDPAGYRTYFPTVDVIAPDTHP
ncbi:MAG: type II toxin-antitoxin system VapC family toxin [Mesorhizobium sp.]